MPHLPLEYLRHMRDEIDYLSEMAIGLSKDFENLAGLDSISDLLISSEHTMAPSRKRED